MGISVLVVKLTHRQTGYVPCIVFQNGVDRFHVTASSRFNDGQRQHAGVSTAILIFTKTGHGGTDNVWFYDMKADGFSLDDKRSPTTENDIPDIIARFHNREAEATRERTEQSFFVPKDEIAGNDYDLSINKYKKTEYVPVEYPSTQEIMAQLRDLQKKIDAEMDALEELLK